MRVYIGVSRGDLFRGSHARPRTNTIVSYFFFFFKRRKAAPSVWRDDSEPLQSWPHPSSLSVSFCFSFWRCYIKESSLQRVIMLLELPYWLLSPPTPPLSLSCVCFHRLCLLVCVCVRCFWAGSPLTPQGASRHAPRAVRYVFRAGVAKNSIFSRAFEAKRMKVAALSPSLHSSSLALSWLCLWWTTRWPATSLIKGTGCRFFSPPSDERVLTWRGSGRIKTTWVSLNSAWSP